jgi:signal transduction histidine kinase
LGNTVGQRNRLTVVVPPPPAQAASLRDRVAAIAELGAATLAAERCAIAFRSGGVGAGEVVYAPNGDSRWDPGLNAILAALENRIGDAAAASGKKRARSVLGSIESIERIVLSADEIGAIAPSENISRGHQLAAAAFADGVRTIRVVIVARLDRARGELDTTLELVAHAVFGEIALAAARASVEFWRAHGSESGRMAAGAKQELVRERAAANYLDEAVAAARRAQPGERFGLFGHLVAAGAGFDQWVVAISDNGSFMVAASSSGQEPFELGGISALEESFRRHILIARWRNRHEGAADRARYFEDEYFGGPYVCIPFEGGAIALASRDTHASAAKAEAIVDRLTPFAMSWMLEREAARRSRLVRQLALRMFAAIDEERGRIARDLHDDQAQLLAAAKIALDGPRNAARPIFKQVEEELRRKTRELRPATLGSASLNEAIEREFDRMTRAGVKAKLICDGAAASVSRPVQQLSFQVVREALSNVIKHARAKSVQITIETGHLLVRVSVADDGCGMSAGHSEGIGLAGIRERLELMGGRLSLVSHATGTTLTAEIPESA